MNNKVYAIIVTYKDRSEKLLRLINRLKEVKIDGIVIIENGATEKLLYLLKQLENDEIKILYLGANTGTANAFMTGMQYVKENNLSEYVWLFDDDNVPENDSLNQIKKFLEKEIEKKNINKIIIGCNRKDKYTYKICTMNDSVWLGLGRINSYWGFHLYDFIKKIFNKVFVNQENEIHVSKVNWKRVNNCAWGGMFFNIALTDTIGFPNKEYFVFLDDYEYSMRLSKNEGTVYLLFNSIVNDPEENEEVSANYNRFQQIIFNIDPYKNYYLGRNYFVFNLKHRTDNRAVFFLNTITFIVLLLIFSVISNTTESLLVSVFTSALKKPFEL